MKNSLEFRLQCLSYLAFLFVLKPKNNNWRARVFTDFYIIFDEMIGNLKKGFIWRTIPSKKPHNE